MGKTLAGRNPAATDRMDYLDAVRGIAVILIVVAHHLLEVPALQKYLYSFMLTLFFLLSGFLYAYKREWEQPFGKIVVKNLKRLIYPFVTFSVINLLWNLAFYQYISPWEVPEYTMKERLVYTLTTYGYNALWYLPSIFWGTLLFLGIRKTKYHHWICISLSVFLIVFYILFDKSLTGKGFPSYVYCYLFRAAMSVVFIYAGYLLFFLFQRMSRLQEWLLLAGCVIVAAVIEWHYLRYPDSFPIVNLAVHRLGNPYVYYLAALSNSVAIILLCKLIPLTKVLFSYWGRNSIVVMALHMDVLIRIGWYTFPKFHVNYGDRINSMIVIAMEFAMAAVLIFVINHFCPFILKFPKLTAKKP